MLFRVRTYVFGVLVSPRRAQTHYNAGQTSCLFRETQIYFTVEKRPYKNRLSRSALHKYCTRVTLSAHSAYAFIFEHAAGIT